MRPPFHAMSLRDNRIAEALPLVRTNWPGLTLEEWRRFVRFFMNNSAADRAGILTLCDEDDYFCGLLAYRLEWDLSLGKILSAPFLVAADLANSSQPLMELLGAAERKAVALSCVGMQIHLANHQDKVALHLGELKFMNMARAFGRKIEVASTS